MSLETTFGTELNMPKPETIKPIAYLAKCYNDDNEVIGYNVWNSGIPVYTKEQILEACAEFVYRKALSRHGYDKYNDADDILDLKEIL